MIQDDKSPALRKGVDFRNTKNATQRVAEFIKPGKKRAPFLRYIRINLPRTTKFVLLSIIAAIGAASFTVARSGHSLFPYADYLLWSVFSLTVLFVAFGLLRSVRIWHWGACIALLALCMYIGGVASNPPFVSNGASVALAATWNIILFASLAYLLMFMLLRYGTIVAAPDNQNFMD